MGVHSLHRSGHVDGLGGGSAHWLSYSLHLFFQAVDVAVDSAEQRSVVRVETPAPHQKVLEKKN